MKKFNTKKFIAVLLCALMLMTSLNLDNIFYAMHNEDGKMIDSTISSEDLTESVETTVTEVSELTEDELAVEVTSLDELANEVTALSQEDNLDSESIYATKRLIVLSDTSEFDTMEASSVVSYDNLYILSYETVSACKKAYKSLSENKNIISVEIDSVMETEDNDNAEASQSTETDTELKKYLDSLEASKEIKVAILDTGIDTTNKLFKNRIIDLGVNLSASGEENSISDDNGHGTEMATIIANNTSDYVKLMPIKVANADGKATVLNTYLGIQKAIENGADIINISMNTYKSATSQVLTNLINEATDKGIVVVVSAGNNSTDTENITPANIDSAIVVSAIDNSNNFADYSNYGETVDYCSYGIYGDKTGTSYAAASVTGILADTLSKELDASILDQYAIDLGDEGKDIYYGNGLVTNSCDPNNDEHSINPLLSIINLDNISEQQLSEMISSSSDVEVGIFLSKLSKEEIEQLRLMETPLRYECQYLTYVLNPQTETAEPISDVKSENYLDYCLDLYQYQKEDLETSEYILGSKNGYFYIEISGDGQKTGKKISTTFQSIYTDTSQKVTLAMSNKSGFSGNSHSLSLKASSCKTIAWNDNGTLHYDNIEPYFTYTRPKYYHATTSTKDVSSTFSIKGISTGESLSDISDEFYIHVSTHSQGVGNPDFGTQKHATAIINLARNSYSQIVKVRYQNIDGSWGTYSTVINKNYDYGSTVSWSRAADATYKAASISYTVTGASTKYVDVYRNTYTITCYDYLTDGTYLGSPGSTTRYYGASISGSEWGTSSPYNNSQYTYYYNSCTTVNPVTGNCSVNRYWTRSTNSYTVTCYDYLTDGTYLGSPGSTTRYYGASISGSEWGTSSPYNNAQYTYYYNSCTTVNPVTGNCSVNRYWTRSINKYTVTYIDVVDSQNGKQLGKTTKSINYGTTVRGSDLGGDTTDNKYYTGYYYVNDTSATVTGNTTVYRIFKVATVDKTATINWVDKSNAYGSRPANVVLKVMNGSTVVKTVTLSDNNSVPATTDIWTYKFTGLQKYDTSTGKEINYTLVEEQPVSLRGELKYDVSFSSDTWTVTNKTDNPEPENIYALKMTGTITWLDENDKYHFRPDSVVVELYQNGKLYDSQTVTGDSYTFTGLDMIDENLNKYEYTIKEKTINNYSTTYKVYDKSNTETDSAGNTITTTTLHSDITNTFTPDDTIRFGELTMKTTFLNQDGKVASASDFKALALNKDTENVYVTLKQMDMSWKPVDAQNGKYVEQYADTYSGNEFNLILTGEKVTKLSDLLYGKYEIVVQNDNDFKFKNIEELSTKNVKFSYENGKYYVTYSYEYEEAKEDLNVNVTLDAWRGYTSSTSIKNFFKVTK